MRIVPDATFLIRAHNRSQALPQRLLREIIARGHIVVLSNEIIVEATRVLRYPLFQARYRLPEADLLEYALFLQSISKMVVLDPLYRARVLRDGSDTHVLQTAVAGDADIIWTHDRDFRDDAVLGYCTARGISVHDEAALLAILMAHDSPVHLT